MRNESESFPRNERWELCIHKGHHRPVMNFGKRSESERGGCFPKDGELCLGRIKSGENLMEVRSNLNVQISCQIWV